MPERPRIDNHQLQSNVRERFMLVNSAASVMLLCRMHAPAVIRMRTVIRVASKSIKLLGCSVLPCHFEMLGWFSFPSVLHLVITVLYILSACPEREFESLYYVLSDNRIRDEGSVTVGCVVNPLPPSGFFLFLLSKEDS